MHSKILAAQVCNNILEEQSKYKEFFQSKLKQYGVSSPQDLTEEQRKKFFDEVDKEYTGEKKQDKDLPE